MINLIGPLDLYTPKVSFNYPSYFIDGGIKHKDKFSNPRTSYGDGDSSTSPLDMTLEREKDFSDYLFALNETIELSSKIYLHGLYGKRLDHQLAIIGDTLNLLKKNSNKEIFMLTDQGETIIFSSHRDKSYEIGSYFSLFTLEEQNILIQGAKYPLKEQYIKLPALSSMGISNKLLSKLEIKAQKPFMIIPYLDN